jgi:hypothetical protein
VSGQANLAGPLRRQVASCREAEHLLKLAHSAVACDIGLALSGRRTLTDTRRRQNSDDTQPSLGLTQSPERERGGEVVRADDDAQQQQLKTTKHR